MVRYKTLFKNNRHVFQSQSFRDKRIGAMRKDKKDDEAGSANPYANLDKTTIVQEVGSYFNMFCFKQSCTSVPSIQRDAAKRAQMQSNSLQAALSYAAWRDNRQNRGNRHIFRNH